jgi:bifunctional UDP-N-acetylglucosamine pyrophosphorylase/glucosamine-1-phosphate N-acetyltransferase
METELTIVILAAGLGTRMKSANAKVLHRAGGKTLIEHVVDTALQLTRPERVFVVVGYQADEVRQILGSRGIGFIEQSDQKGTGHAVMVGREALASLPGRLMILYGDCPLISAETLRNLVSSQQQSGAAGAVITTILDNPFGYGRVLQDNSGNVLAIVEQKAATPEQLLIQEINSGIYCFDAADFWRHVDQIRPDNPVNEY